jgi:hypothetical protein
MIQVKQRFGEHKSVNLWLKFVDWDLKFTNLPTFTGVYLASLAFWRPMHNFLRPFLSRFLKINPQNFIKIF